MSNESSAPTPRPREPAANILQQALDDEMALAATLHEVLGRLAGPNFHSLFRLFGEQRRQIEQWKNEIAARVRALGGAPRAERRSAPALDQASASRLAAEAPARGLVGDVLGLHEGVARRLRADLGRCSDAATARLLTSLTEFHETAAWMLRIARDGPEVPGAGS